LYNGSIFFCSFTGGLLLLLRVSNKRATRTTRQGVIYNRLRSYYTVLGCLIYDSKRQPFMSQYLAI